jgi:hypothetical protein
VARLRFGLRRRWNNHTGNQGADPLRVYTPATLEEIAAIVTGAEADGCTVRAAGSGHSWSDVALTTGYLIAPDRLRDPLPLDGTLLAPQWQARLLVQVQSGMRIHDLNAHLAGVGQALPNMGGYDGQTVAGVISTSTHGSGVAFGPMNDLVRSLDLVAAGGRVYRIERSGGPTAAAEYAARYPSRSLIQDTEVFDAVVVGMGCMGVIYSVILEVCEAFGLEERRFTSTWESERVKLESMETLDAHEHYEVYLNPYPGRDGTHLCLVTTRHRCHLGEDVRPSRLRRNLLPELLARFPLTPLVLSLIMGLWPRAVPRLLDAALRMMRKRRYINRSDRVFNIGAANYMPAYSSEIAVPVDAEGRHIQAIDRVIAIAAERRRLGNVYQGSPISLRFVRGSDAYLSMMNGRDVTMMIELIQPTHTEGGFELLAAYEDTLYELQGRPHWGQVNTLTGSNALIERMYPNLSRWRAVHERFNASGVFDGPFAKRVGFSVTHYTG